jgi:hypothetical protein
LANFLGAIIAKWAAADNSLAANAVDEPAVRLQRD